MEGWRRAALEENAPETDRIEAWFAQRLQQLSDGQLGLEVGHVDFLALPDL